MAILLEEQEKKFNWGAVFILVLIFGALGGVAYVAFSNPEVIEIVAPLEVVQTKELSQVKLDTAEVKSKADALFLRSYAGPQTTGKLGRPNPFIKF